MQDSLSYIDFEERKKISFMLLFEKVFSINLLTIFRRDDFEKQNGDLKHRIDRLNSHVGDYDGELTNLRMKVEFLESEIDKLKDTNKRLRDDNGRLQGVSLYIS